MSYSDQNNPYAYVPGASSNVAALATESERAGFIRRTYAHLAGAVMAFIGIEALIFAIVPTATLDQVVGMMAGSRWGWLVVLGVFMAVNWVAHAWASSSASQSLQYLGLSLYVVAEAVIFIPILHIAARFSGPETIPTAGIITGIVFGGLTAMVFITRADLSGWGKYLWLAGFLALGLVVCGALFNFPMGLWFVVPMIGLMCAYILYDTSNVLHHYRLDQHVAAALTLFTSLATLFYYILRFVMELNRR